MSRGLFVRIDCDIFSKPSFQDIVEDGGVSEAEALGLLAKLWCYFQSHSEAGRMPMTIGKLVKRVGGSEEFWGVVEAAGWLSQDEGFLVIPEFEDRFWDGSPQKIATDRAAEAARKQRQRSSTPSKVRHAGHERDTTVTEAGVTPVSENVTDPEYRDNESIEIKENIHIREKEEDSVPQDVSRLSELFDEFWGNLSAAGMHLPPKKPYWLRQELSNGSGAVLLAASREIANTGLLQCRVPAHLGNFKNRAWVKRLAEGEFSFGKDGTPPPADPGSPGPAAPAGKPPDPEDEWIMFHPAGKRMRRREIKEWLRDPDNLEVFREYQEKYGRKPEVKPPPPVDDSKPIPAIDLSLPPDVSTEEAKKIALNQIAQWQQNEENKDGTIAR